MTALFWLCLLIFALNLAPAFAPPTWMLLTAWGFQHPDTLPWLLALLAASSATLGRSCLALGAKQLTRQRWFGDTRREGLALVAQWLERRRSSAGVAFLLFSLSPLPSNVLFLAYGLSGAPLLRLALPFFAGRLVSYTLALAGGVWAARQLPAEWREWLSGYFVVTQLALLGLVWLFARTDWRRYLREN